MCFLIAGLQLTPLVRTSTLVLVVVGKLDKDVTVQGQAYLLQ
jgi:hypothetical protein